MIDYVEIFEEYSIRFDKLIWLPSALVIDAESECFCEFCEELPESSAAIYEQLPALARFKDTEEYPSPDEVSEALCMARANGFLAQVARPVMTKVGKSSYEFSWGYTHIAWLYGETLEQLVERAVEWSKEWRTAENRKGAKRA